MEEIIKNFLNRIISQPDQLSVTIDDSEDITEFYIKAEDKDTAKIIGKHGYTIKALSDLLFLYQQKNSQPPFKRIVLKLN